MRRLLIAASLLAAMAPAVAQESGHSGKYTNKELGISFAGVYGWESAFAEGAGIWTDLATYSDAAFDAKVILQVRDNPYKTLEQLGAALRKEFQEGGEVAEGQPAYKDVSIKDVDMKKGQKLPGIEAQADVLTINEEGKKREYFVQARTYFGKKRLFRVTCSVRRSRARRVKDRFGIAIASLVVKGEEESVARGVKFWSKRGFYRCIVPEGFGAVLPAADSNSDMRFESRGREVVITVFSYSYDGDVLDQQDDMLDYYGDDIEFIQEEIEILGGEGFIAKVKRQGGITFVLGVVRDERVFRVHTSAKEKHAEKAQQAHEKFLKDFAIGN